MSFSERFDRAYKQAQTVLTKPGAALLLWGRTYTSWEERFSYERLELFERTVAALDVV